jgi:hypothetical protein
MSTEWLLELCCQVDAALQQAMTPWFAAVLDMHELTSLQGQLAAVNHTQHMMMRRSTEGLLLTLNQDKAPMLPIVTLSCRSGTHKKPLGQEQLLPSGVQLPSFCTAAGRSTTHV